MPSSWIQSRATRSVATRFHVKYRLGGRESRVRHGGAFATKREALTRKRVIDGEMAALRVPDVDVLASHRSAPTLAQASETWRESRLDVRESTRTFHRTALRRALPHLGDRPIDEISPADVAQCVVALNEGGTAPASIRKTLTVLAQVFDHFEIEPNPARDHRVRVPRGERTEIAPPSAEHIERVLGADHARTRSARQWIVELYEAWGKPVRAAHYRDPSPASELAAD